MDSIMDFKMDEYIDWIREQLPSWDTAPITVLEVVFYYFNCFILFWESDVVPLLNKSRIQINETLSNYEPWQVVLMTFLVAFSLVKFKSFFTVLPNQDLYTVWKQKTFRFIISLPIVKRIVNRKLTEVRSDIQASMSSNFKGDQYKTSLPHYGWQPEKIFDEIQKYDSFSKINWKNGRASGAVYVGSDKTLDDLMEKVYGMTAYTNPLHPDIFPGAMKMEAEIVRMTCSLFKGDSRTCGTVTSGGTESIFMACKAYRDYARHERGIQWPEIVVPQTAHAAFDKSASMLGIRIVHIPIDQNTMKVNMNKMRKAINRNTCMLVGSAPQFPHGICDPIDEIARLGQKRKIPVHVDSCLGGFLAVFMERAGFKMPRMDFSLGGVTSISADTHKYGYAPKGSSVVMYRNEVYRHYQFFVQPDWPGGIYASPTIAGSRSGAILATCWASMIYHGREGYIASTKRIIETSRYLKRELTKIKGLKVLGDPLMSVIAVTSTRFDVYRLSGLLTEKGWSLNVLQFPPAFHICVTLQHTQKGVVDALLEDIRSFTQKLLQSPKEKATGSSAIYGMAQTIPDRSIVSEFAWCYLDACYSTANAQNGSTNGVNGEKKSGKTKPKK